MTTDQALDLVEQERERQKEIGMDGNAQNPDELIHVALAYLGRATTNARRNADTDQREMLIKTTAVLIDAIERS